VPPYKIELDNRVYNRGKLEMCGIDIEKHTEFGKVRDIWNDHCYENACLCEFVRSVVMNEDMLDEKNKNGHGIMLQDLSNIHVLVSKPDFPFTELTQRKKCSIDFTQANSNFILGYIWLCPWKIEKKAHLSYYFIQYIDTRIAGLNIAEYMIDAFEGGRGDRLLFPYEVEFGARIYWKRYFHRVYQVTNKKQLKQMIKEYELHDYSVKWENLFDVLE